MSEIIEIRHHIIGNEEVNSVDARELHKALGNKKQFANWINYQITSLGLVKNKDYMVFNKKVKNLEGGRPTTEYILTLDIAKHIALASRTKEGKEIRAYFIEVEKRYRSTDSMPDEAVISLLKQMSESLNIMATNQAHILERLDVLEGNVQMHTPTRALEHMPPMVANCMRGRKWSRAETDTLIRMYDEGYTSAEIGAVVGKSAVAVRCRLSRLFAEDR